MNIQDKMNKIKDQLTELRNISKDILAANETIEGRQRYMDIIESYGIFDLGWGTFGRFRCAIHAVYNEHDPTFTLPKFQCYTHDLDRVYAREHGYLLIKIDTSMEYNPIKIVGLDSLFESYKENTKELTLESTYTFVMDCIEYISDAALTMLCLPIFNPNELVFLSLVCHYYFDYKFEVEPTLRYIHSVAGTIHNDFKRMVFETNGAHPLSVRGNLPILSHYARKKSYGHYRRRNNAPLSFVKDMKSNKALNLRKAFSNMENLLTIEPKSSYVERDGKIAFMCTVGVQTHYDKRKKFTGISVHPVEAFAGNMRLGILSTCMPPDSATFSPLHVGWVDFDCSASIYDRYEYIFDYFEDDVVNTIEDNYNFLLEKLPDLNKKALRNDMLKYIMEGR